MDKVFTTVKDICAELKNPYYEFSVARNIAAAYIVQSLTV